jgi:SAM-dependent methyltransferase
MTDLYREPELDIYEKVHYGRGDHVREVDDILSWYGRNNARVLDIGCSGGLHVLEFAKRGFVATGIDIEASAIRRARERCRDQKLNAGFYVLDLVHDSFSELGRFNLVYSIGNVISHVDKICAQEVFRKIRTCIDRNGMLLFDVLMIEDQFPEEVREDDLKIIWERKVNRRTGEISLKGRFLEWGLVKDFRVWGYGIDEIKEILMQSGFCAIEFSDRLDFSCAGTQCAAPVCLRFRARPKELL